MNYPEHKHPHGIENTEPNEHRIWCCEECECIFEDTEIREDSRNDEWGHICKSYPYKVNRCESHLEPFVPDMGEGNVSRVS